MRTLTPEEAQALTSEMGDLFQAADIGPVDCASITLAFGFAAVLSAGMPPETVLDMAVNVLNRTIHVVNQHNTPTEETDHGE